MLKKGSATYISILTLVLIIFTCTYIAPYVIRAGVSDAAVLGLPEPGRMFEERKQSHVPVLKGIAVNPDSPFVIDFLVDTPAGSRINASEMERLISYFLAGIAMSEEDIWVNLSPYETDRIVNDNLAVTDLGRDLLAQDYILKQLSSSLTHPDTELGKKYWSSLTADSLQLTPVESEAFNKIWITPGTASVTEQGLAAIVTDATLEVMTERDYVAQKMESSDSEIDQAVHDNSSDMLLPEVKEKINNSANFARLRQIYNSLILATWFKKKFFKSFYSVYMNSQQTNGIDDVSILDKHKIYELYVKAFEKGVYDIVRNVDDGSASSGKKQRYFSGGAIFKDIPEKIKIESGNVASAVSAVLPDGFARVRAELSAIESALKYIPDESVNLAYKNLKGVYDHLNLLLERRAGIKDTNSQQYTVTLQEIIRYSNGLHALHRDLVNSLGSAFTEKMDNGIDGLLLKRELARGMGEDAQLRFEMQRSTTDEVELVEHMIELVETFIAQMNEPADAEEMSFSESVAQKYADLVRQAKSNREVGVGGPLQAVIGRPVREAVAFRQLEYDNEYQVLYSELILWANDRDPDGLYRKKLKELSFRKAQAQKLLAALEYAGPVQKMFELSPQESLVLDMYDRFKAKAERSSGRMEQRHAALKAISDKLFELTVDEAEFKGFSYYQTKQAHNNFFRLVFYNHVSEPQLIKLIQHASPELTEEQALEYLREVFYLTQERFSFRSQNAAVAAEISIEKAEFTSQERRDWNAIEIILKHGGAPFETPPSDKKQRIALLKAINKQISLRSFSGIIEYVKLRLALNRWGNGDFDGIREKSYSIDQVAARYQRLSIHSLSVAGTARRIAAMEEETLNQAYAALENTAGIAETVSAHETIDTEMGRGPSFTDKLKKIAYAVIIGDKRHPGAAVLLKGAVYCAMFPLIAAALFAGIFYPSGAGADEAPAQAGTLISGADGAPQALLIDASLSPDFHDDIMTGDMVDYYGQSNLARMMQGQLPNLKKSKVKDNPPVVLDAEFRQEVTKLLMTEPQRAEAILKKYTKYALKERKMELDPASAAWFEYISAFVELSKIKKMSIPMVIQETMRDLQHGSDLSGKLQAPGRHILSPNIAIGKLANTWGAMNFWKDSKYGRNVTKYVDAGVSFGGEAGEWLLLSELIYGGVDVGIEFARLSPAKRQTFIKGLQAAAKNAGTFGDYAAAINFNLIMYAFTMYDVLVTIGQAGDTHDFFNFSGGTMISLGDKGPGMFNIEVLGFGVDSEDGAFNNWKNMKEQGSDKVMPKLFNIDLLEAFHAEVGIMPLQTAVGIKIGNGFEASVEAFDLEEVLRHKGVSGRWKAILPKINASIAGKRIYIIKVAGTEFLYFPTIQETEKGKYELVEREDNRKYMLDLTSPGEELSKVIGKLFGAALNQLQYATGNGTQPSLKNLFQSPMPVKIPGVQEIVAHMASLDARRETQRLQDQEDKKAAQEKRLPLKIFVDYRAEKNLLTGRTRIYRKVQTEEPIISKAGIPETVNGKVQYHQPQWKEYLVVDITDMFAREGYDIEAAQDKIASIQANIRSKNKMIAELRAENKSTLKLERSVKKYEKELARRQEALAQRRIDGYDLQTEQYLTLIDQWPWFREYMDYPGKPENLTFDNLPWHRVFEIINKGIKDKSKHIRSSGNIKDDIEAVQNVLNNRAVMTPLEFMNAVLTHEQEIEAPVVSIPMRSLPQMNADMALMIQGLLNYGYSVDSMSGGVKAHINNYFNVPPIFENVNVPEYENGMFKLKANGYPKTVKTDMNVQGGFNTSGIKFAAMMSDIRNNNISIDDSPQNMKTHHYGDNGDTAFPLNVVSKDSVEINGHKYKVYVAGKGLKCDQRLQYESDGASQRRTVKDQAVKEGTAFIVLDDDDKDNHSSYTMDMDDYLDTQILDDVGGTSGKPEGKKRVIFINDFKISVPYGFILRYNRDGYAQMVPVYLDEYKRLVKEHMITQAPVMVSDKVPVYLDEYKRLVKEHRITQAPVRVSDKDGRIYARLDKGVYPVIDEQYMGYDAQGNPTTPFFYRPDSVILNRPEGHPDHLTDEEIKKKRYFGMVMEADGTWYYVKYAVGTFEDMPRDKDGEVVEDGLTEVPQLKGKTPGQKKKLLAAREKGSMPKTEQTIHNGFDADTFNKAVEQLYEKHRELSDKLADIRRARAGNGLKEAAMQGVPEENARALLHLEYLKAMGVEEYDWKNQMHGMDNTSQMLSKKKDNARKALDDAIARIKQVRENYLVSFDVKFAGIVLRIQELYSRRDDNLAQVIQQYQQQGENLLSEYVYEIGSFNKQLMSYETPEQTEKRIADDMDVIAARNVEELRASLYPGGVLPPWKDGQPSRSQAIINTYNRAQEQTAAEIGQIVIGDAAAFDALDPEGDTPLNRYFENDACLDYYMSVMNEQQQKQLSDTYNKNIDPMKNPRAFVENKIGYADAWVANEEKTARRGVKYYGLKAANARRNQIKDEIEDLTAPVGTNYDEDNPDTPQDETEQPLESIPFMEQQIEAARRAIDDKEQRIDEIDTEMAQTDDPQARQELQAEKDKIEEEIKAAEDRKKFWEERLYGDGTEDNVGAEQRYEDLTGVSYDEVRINKINDMLAQLADHPIFGTYSDAVALLKDRRCWDNDNDSILLNDNYFQLIRELDLACGELETPNGLTPSEEDELATKEARLAEIPILLAGIKASADPLYRRINELQSLIRFGDNTQENQQELAELTAEYFALAGLPPDQQLDLNADTYSGDLNSEFGQLWDEQAVLQERVDELRAKRQDAKFTYGVSYFSTPGRQPDYPAYDENSDSNSMLAEADNYLNELTKEYEGDDEEKKGKIQRAGENADPEKREEARKYNKYNAARLRQLAGLYNATKGQLDRMLGDTSMDLIDLARRDSELIADAQKAIEEIIVFSEKFAEEFPDVSKYITLSRAQWEDVMYGILYAADGHVDGEIQGENVNRNLGDIRRDLETMAMAGSFYRRGGFNLNLSTISFEEQHRTIQATNLGAEFQTGRANHLLAVGMTNTGEWQQRYAGNGETEGSWVSSKRLMLFEKVSGVSDDKETHLAYVGWADVGFDKSGNLQVHRISWREQIKLLPKVFNFTEFSAGIADMRGWTPIKNSDVYSFDPDKLDPASPNYDSDYAGEDIEKTDRQLKASQTVADLVAKIGFEDEDGFYWDVTMRPVFERTRYSVKKDKNPDTPELDRKNRNVRLNLSGQVKKQIRSKSGEVTFTPGAYAGTDVINPEDFFGELGTKFTFGRGKYDLNLFAGHQQQPGAFYGGGELGTTTDRDSIFKGTRFYSRLGYSQNELEGLTYAFGMQGQGLYGKGQQYDLHGIPVDSATDPTSYDRIMAVFQVLHDRGYNPELIGEKRFDDEGNEIKDRTFVKVSGKRMTMANGQHFEISKWANAKIKSQFSETDPDKTLFAAWRMDSGLMATASREYKEAVHSIEELLRSRHGRELLADNGFIVELKNGDGAAAVEAEAKKVLAEAVFDEKGNLIPPKDEEGKKKKIKDEASMYSVYYQVKIKEKYIGEDGKTYTEDAYIDIPVGLKANILVKSEAAFLTEDGEKTVNIKRIRKVNGEDQEYFEERKLKVYKLKSGHVGYNDALRDLVRPGAAETVDVFPMFVEYTEPAQERYKQFKADEKKYNADPQKYQYDPDGDNSEFAGLHGAMTDGELLTNEQLLKMFTPSEDYYKNLEYLQKNLPEYKGNARAKYTKAEVLTHISGSGSKGFDKLKAVLKDGRSYTQHEILSIFIDIDIAGRKQLYVEPRLVKVGTKINEKGEEETIYEHVKSPTGELVFKYYVRDAKGNPVDIEFSDAGFEALNRVNARMMRIPQQIDPDKPNLMANYFVTETEFMYKYFEWEDNYTYDRPGLQVKVIKGYEGVYVPAYEKSRGALEFSMPKRKIARYSQEKSANVREYFRDIGYASEMTERMDAFLGDDPFDERADELKYKKPGAIKNILYYNPETADFFIPAQDLRRTIKKQLENINNSYAKLDGRLRALYGIDDLEIEFELEKQRIRKEFSHSPDVMAGKLNAAEEFFNQKIRTYAEHQFKLAWITVGHKSELRKKYEKEMAKQTAAQIKQKKSAGYKQVMAVEYQPGGYQPGRDNIKGYRGSMTRKLTIRPWINGVPRAIPVFDGTEYLWVPRWGKSEDDVYRGGGAALRWVDGINPDVIYNDYNINNRKADLRDQGLEGAYERGVARDVYRPNKDRTGERRDTIFSPVRKPERLLAKIKQNISKMEELRRVTDVIEKTHVLDIKDPKYSGKKGEKEMQKFSTTITGRKSKRSGKAHGRRRTPSSKASVAGTEEKTSVRKPAKSAEQRALEMIGASSALNNNAAPKGGVDMKGINVEVTTGSALISDAAFDKEKFRGFTFKITEIEQVSNI